MKRTAAILVVDDDDGFRAFLAGALTAAGHRVCEAKDGASALLEAVKERPWAALVDVNLPVINGYEVCRTLKELHRIPVILVSGYRDQPLDEAAGLLIGADDYLVKPVDRSELLARVRRLGAPIALAHESSPGVLTEREREVMQLLVDGHTIASIASELVIAPKTVSTHVQRILGKLGVHSRAEAMAIAVRNGLVPRVH